MIGGDLIVEIDGQEIKDAQHLNHVLSNHRSGDTVSVVFYHGKQQRTARIQLDEAKAGGQA